MSKAIKVFYICNTTVELGVSGTISLLFVLLCLNAVLGAVELWSSLESGKAYSRLALATCRSFLVSVLPDIKVKKE